ncbi:MAG: hypothetical protein U5L00_20025 [Desulfovermiculus sp.]|nr:hypothetical protein [Desulfovermiculus sp.]
MAPQSVADLASALPNNLRYLSALVARKPDEFTAEWAATPDEAFSLYTRTSTVNLILSWNNFLAEQGWPFPAYLNHRDEVDVSKSWPLTRWKLLRSIITGKRILQTPLLAFALKPTPAEREQSTSNAMTFLFWRHSKRIFQYWRRHHLLKNKETIVDSISCTYKKRLFAACMPTVLGLLDFILRNYFQTERLNVSIQTLRNAFEKACILPKHLKSGSGIWDVKNEPENTILFPSLEQDLRLPGVFLSSFVEFGSSYYGWYATADPSRQAPLNRHAIMHCASNYWSLNNAVKLLSFFDLTLRLERVLKIVIHGPAAYPQTA